MKCAYPTETRTKYEGTSFPISYRCGKCDACLATRRAEKTLRIVLEMALHQENLFVTLTYAPGEVPLTENTYEPTLSKKDMILFMKRLRITAQRAGLPKFRFFAAAEYGEKTGRPHYHYILFGFPEYRKDLIDKAWNKGLVHVGPATGGAAAYTAWYTTKKGKYGFDKGTEAVPEFSLQSRHPGLGYGMIPHIVKSMKARMEQVSKNRYQSKMAHCIIENLNVLHFGKAFYPIDKRFKEKCVEYITDRYGPAPTKKHKMLDTIYTDALKTGLDFRIEEILCYESQKKAEKKLQKASSNRTH